MSSVIRTNEHLRWRGDLLCVMYAVLARVVVSNNNNNITERDLLRENCVQRRNEKHYILRAR